VLELSAELGVAELLGEAARSGRAKALGVAGGDGSVAAAAAVALEHDLPLAVIPAGTLNHFARDVGLESAQDAVEAVLAGSAVRVDVAGDDGWVELRVADDGEGIPEDVLPKIFEPHFSTKTSGSGLGLAISRQLVDGWGGSIAVSSERGKGTEVVIRLRGAD